MASLLFIYNADSGLPNALLDTGRRIFRPKAYPCALCMITYGPFGIKRDWKKFIASLPYTVSFLHKDELPHGLKTEDLSFPCLLLQDTGVTRVLLDGAQFKKIADLHSLEQTVRSVIV